MAKLGPIVLLLLHLNSISTSIPWDNLLEGDHADIQFTKFGQVAIFNSHYVIPICLYKSEVIGQYTELHYKFKTLYDLIKPDTHSNLTHSIIELLIEELNT